MNSAVAQIKKKPTLKTIASALHLSSAAISCILNGKGKDIKISDKTIFRVKAYANKINYRPHGQARNLRMGRTGTLGLCIELADPVTGELMYRLLRGISGAAMHDNKTIMIMDLDRREVDGVTALERLVQNNVDGIIAAYRDDPGYQRKINELVAAGHKIVLVLDHYGECNCPAVDANHKASAIKAVKYLQDKGFSRIAHLGNNEKFSVGSFIYAGWLEQSMAIGVTPDKWYFQGHDSELKFGIKQFLASRERFDAVFCWNDKSAAALSNTLQDYGLEIEIMGYDNRSFVHYMKKSFSSVDYPLEEIGRVAVETLLAGDMNKRSILIESEIVER